MTKILKSLYFQVILGIIIGICVGVFYPDIAVEMKPLGDGFIKLVKMVIAPLIFCSIVLGIAGMSDVKQIGKIGAKSLLYFEVMTTIALIIGLIFVNLIKPGEGMNVDPNTLDASSVEQYISKSKESESLLDFIIGIIPENVIASIASANLLQALVFAVLFGVAMIKIGRKNAEPVLNVIDSFLKGLFSIIKMIMYLAPIGAMGAMGFTIGKYGLKSLESLGLLMLSFYATCLIFIIIVVGGVLHFYAKVNIFKLLKYISEEILIVLGTSSSESALPGLMKKMEDAGCSKPVVGLVVPTGYSFNLDGTSIYLTMAAVFITQALDMHMTLQQEITLLLVLLLTSKGAAGVTGSGFVTLAATLPVVGHVPVEAVGLVLGIDRFMSEARAITNLVGNAAAVIVVAKWENAVDMVQLNKVLK